MTIQPLGPAGELTLEPDGGGVGRVGRPAGRRRGPARPDNRDDRSGRAGRWSDRKLIATLVAGMIVATAGAGAWAIGRGGSTSATQAGLPAGHPAVTTLDGADVNGMPNDELEGVVEAHPDAVSTRLLLVERYLDAAAKETNDDARKLQLRKAVGHAEEAEKRATNADDHARALRDLGWGVAHLGDPATGVGLVQQSLQEAPGNPDALWYLAVIQFRVMGDPASATDTLGQLIASPAATPAQVQRAQAELAQTRAAA
jgi:Tetratricopeptide repeat